MAFSDCCWSAVCRRCLPSRNRHSAWGDMPPFSSMHEPEQEAPEEETFFGGYLLSEAFVKNPTLPPDLTISDLVDMPHMRTFPSRI